jgi:hypothetical protein
MRVFTWSKLLALQFEMTNATSQTVAYIGAWEPKVLRERDHHLSLARLLRERALMNHN